MNDMYFSPNVIEWQSFYISCNTDITQTWLGRHLYKVDTWNCIISYFFAYNIDSQKYQLEFFFFRNNPEILHPSYE